MTQYALYEQRSPGADEFDRVSAPGPEEEVSRQGAQRFRRGIARGTARSLVVVPVPDPTPLVWRRGNGYVGHLEARYAP